jgi:hypothetical protein
MRLHRHLGIALAAVLVGCEHDEITELIARDGATSIPIIEMNTASAGGFVSGTRATNRYLAVGTFDTSFADAFGRSSSRLANLRTDPLCYGSDSLVRPWTGGPPATYTAPKMHLPAVLGTARTIALFGCGPLSRIVPSGNTGNGAGNTVWEAWYTFDQLSADTRYIMGFARYHLVQRGALDHAEMLLTGTVTDPDTLVFDGFAPGGKKGDAAFTTNCASVNIIQPTAGANPHFLGGQVTDATGFVDLDQTVCANAASVWGARYTAKSPIPRNNATTIGASQYNFFVVWEALPDSTPNYDKPVWREQIAPVLAVGGAPINNAYAPIPERQLTPAELALLPASTAVPDTIRITANRLVPLAAGSAYQLWLAPASGDPAKVTGRVVRLNAGAVVDTLSDVSEFTIGAGMDGARVEFDFLPFRGPASHTAMLTIATAGATTLPSAQPLWETMNTLKTPGGPVPSASGTLSFGSYNAGSSALLFGAAGSSTGGIYGHELRQDIKRIPRPPVGYQYEGWLISSTAASPPMALGPLLSPYPDLQPLTNADISNDPPLSGVEVTQAALRFVADSATFYCGWDRVQVRLGPKNGDGTTLPPTILLSGNNPRVGC